MFTLFEYYSNSIKYAYLKQESSLGFWYKTACPQALQKIIEVCWKMYLFMCVMVDQREALAVTTQLIDTVYFGSPYRDSNCQPLGQ